MIDGLMVFAALFALALYITITFWLGGIAQDYLLAHHYPFSFAAPWLLTVTLLIIVPLSLAAGLSE